MSKPVRSIQTFKAKYLYRGVGTFWGHSGELVVYTFIWIFTENKSNNRSSRFFSLKIVNRNKIIVCQVEPYQFTSQKYSKN